MRKYKVKQRIGILSRERLIKSNNFLELTFINRTTTILGDNLTQLFGNPDPATARRVFNPTFVLFVAKHQRSRIYIVHNLLPERPEEQSPSGQQPSI
ncbi:hypothetical protein EMIT0196P_30070 [Pseudomonas chlororaphis]